MTYPRYKLRIVVLVFLFACLGDTPSILALDGDLMALGEWRLRLKSNQFDAIFPRQRQVVVASTPRNTAVRRFPNPRKVCHECQLYIYPNGTFALFAAGDSDATRGSAATRKARSAAKEENKEAMTNNNRLPVHGRWFAANNPHCATDKFYQSIRLESYPRRQQQQREDGDLLMLQRNQLTFHGRLAGQFQRGRRLARITHGKILVDNLLSDPKSSRWQARPIVASFCAQQMTRLDADEE